MVVLPGGRIGFVEIKAPGQRARPLQLARHRQLRKLGCYVAVLDDPAKMDTILDEIGRFHSDQSVEEERSDAHAGEG